MLQSLPELVRVIFILACCALLSSKSLGLATPVHENSLINIDIEFDEVKSQQEKIANQRYHYELAKSAIAKEDWDKFNAYYALLGDYPLTPYLDFALLKRDLPQLPLKQIDLFLASNKGAFLETRAREQLLYALAKQKEWSLYQQYYREELQPKELHCFQLLARINTGDKTAFDDVANIWIHPKSLPKSCDPLFKAWRNNLGLTNEVAWARFTAAMQAKNTGLARYVRNQMTGETKAYASQFLMIHAYPYRVKNRKLFYEINTKNQQIIAHGVKRVARKDPKLALKYWEGYESRQLFDEKIATDAKLSIAKRLMFKGFISEAENLIQQSAALKQASVVEQFLRESLKAQQWEKVIQWIDYLDPEKQDSDRWQYWRARAQESLGIEDTADENLAIYQNLAKNRSFYGFLAADILGSPYSLTDRSDKADPSTVQIVTQMPEIRRAKELWLRGNYPEAQAEWLFVTKKMNPKELKAAGTLAAEWGWHNKGIMAMISGGHWDHLEVRFPLAYQNEIQRVSNETKVEIPLLYAITRQESAFKEHAKSHAGAMGLMQLLPSTAKQTARKNGIKIQKKDLLNPATNLSLGGHYLSELLDKFNGNRILAAAAYNAGPHRVSRWLNDTSQVPFDVWIETIPFHETRGYVQNILAFSVIYAQKLGQTTSFITELEATFTL